MGSKNTLKNPYKKDLKKQAIIRILDAMKTLKQFDKQPTEDSAHPRTSPTAKTSNMHRNSRMKI
ncbi:MAG: hypothetical protein ACTHZ1_11255 [Sphingobacterium sp.]